MSRLPSTTTFVSHHHCWRGRDLARPPREAVASLAEKREEEEGASLGALHKRLKTVEERHALFVPSVVDALKDGAVPTSAAADVEHCLAAHIGISLLLRNHLKAHAPEVRRGV